MGLLSNLWGLLNEDLTGSSSAKIIHHASLGKCVFFKVRGSDSYLEAMALCPPQSTETVFVFPCAVNGPNDEHLGFYRKCLSQIASIKTGILKQVDIGADFGVTLINVPRNGDFAGEYVLEVETTDGNARSITCTAGTYTLQAG